MRHSPPNPLALVWPGPNVPDPATVLTELLSAHDQAAARGAPILTDDGVPHVRRLVLAWSEYLGVDVPAAPACPVALPHWDDADRRLWLGGLLLKTFRKRAPHQELILAAFEEEGWAVGRIDDPLPLRRGETDGDRRERLHNTVHSLNRGLPEGTIHFSTDGTGEGVRWERRPPNGREHPNSDT